MAKKKSTARSPKKRAAKASDPRSFAGVIRTAAQPVQHVAKALRELVYRVLPDAQERFYGGAKPLAMYRTVGDACWIQPQLRWCNLYFTRGTELPDPHQLLNGSSDRFRYLSIRAVAEIDALPISEWLKASEALNLATIGDGMPFEQVLQRMRKICLALPDTKETLTWGIPHFRVAEKIFCGCAEDRGAPRIGLKMERFQSEVMMKLPGIVKSPYSRPGDGWVTIDPNVFDDWEEIETLLTGSYRLIAPKRTLAKLGDRSTRPAASKPRTPKPRTSNRPAAAAKRKRSV